MNTTTKEANQLLIVGITPYFLEKEAFWFEENLQQILDARHTQNFFEDNIIYLQKGSTYQFSQFLRKVDEMGYERVFKVTDPGEFAQHGGIIDIFPVNSISAVRLDFLGNEIDSIKILSAQGAGVQDRSASGVRPASGWEKSREILKKRLKSQKLYSDLKGLKPGDYLVHLDHGIGQFIGIEKFQTTEKESQEYYVLQYDKEDKLYVPLGLERKLSKFVSFQDPKVSRLGSSLWQKTK